jgi:peptide/nickel transport system permease protein
VIPTIEAPDTAVIEVGERDVAARTQWQLFRRRFFRHKAAMFGLTVLVLLILACFGAKYWTFYPRGKTNILDIGESPSKAHWFGTDSNGRDYLTRTAYAGQLSLKIGLAVALIATVVGTAVGSIAGWYGKWVDEFFSRLVDLYLVFPALVMLAVIGRKIADSNSFLWWDLGDKIWFYKIERDLPIILALAFFGWMQVARVVRGQVLSLKQKEFVEAARAAGAGGARIVIRHILPNCVGVIMVNLTLSVANAIVAESTLSFLGLGVQEPQSSWGKMIYDAKGFVGTPKVYLLYFPGLMLLLVVLSVNFLGDGLRDAFDPKSKQD